MRRYSDWAIVAICFLLHFIAKSIYSSLIRLSIISIFFFNRRRLHRTESEMTKTGAMNRVKFQKQTQQQRHSKP